MQVVGTVVGGQGVGLSIEGEFTFRDAVAKTPHDTTEIRLLFEVVINGIVARQHIYWITSFVRHQHANHPRPVIGNGRLDRAIFENEQFDGFALMRGVEFLWVREGIHCGAFAFCFIHGATFFFWFGLATQGDQPEQG